MKSLYSIKAEDTRSPLKDWVIGRRHRLDTFTQSGLALPNKYIQGTSAKITNYRLVDIVSSNVPEIPNQSTVICHELNQVWCDLPGDILTCKIPLECIWGLYKEDKIKLFPDRAIVQILDYPEKIDSLFLPDCYREVHRDKGRVLLSTIKGIERGDLIFFTPFKGYGLDFTLAGEQVLFLEERDIHVVIE